MISYYEVFIVLKLVSEFQDQWTILASDYASDSSFSEVCGKKKNNRFDSNLKCARTAPATALQVARSVSVLNERFLMIWYISW